MLTAGSATQNDGILHRFHFRNGTRYQGRELARRPEMVEESARAGGLQESREEDGTFAVSCHHHVITHTNSKGRIGFQTLEAISTQ